MDSVHVPSAAGGVGERGQVSARSRRYRRSRLVAHLLPHRAARDMAGHGGCDPDSRTGPVPPVRHRVGAHQGRPRHHDRDHLDLHLHQGIPAIRDELHRCGRAADHRAALGGRVCSAKKRAAGKMNTLHGRQRIRLILRLTAAVAITLFFLFPIYWLFMISFKTPDEIFSFPPKWYPGQIQFGNYAVLFKDGDAATVGNSLVVAGASTLIAMFVGTICAYSLARFKTGGEHLANWIISQRMVPPIAVVFPIFLLYVWLGWVDTFVGVILLYTSFNLPYVIWMMRGYILDIPQALEESALVDGCTRWQVIWKVVFPMT